MTATRRSPVGTDRPPLRRGARLRATVPLAVRPPGEGRRLTFQPALEGLRAVALVGVLAYHSSSVSGGLPGGFLGVSLFLTLSGFVVAGSVGVGHRLRPRRFWARRVRRLAPALVVTVGAVVTGAHLGLGEPSGRVRLPGDVAAALGGWANWWFASGGEGYGATLRAPSPLLHTWSLAVEVQLYLVVLALLAVAARSRHPARTLSVAAGVVVVASWAAGWWWAPTGAGRAYYGTDVRAAEVAVGVVAAAAWAHPGWRARITDPGRWAVAVRTVVAAGAVAAMGWLWTTASPADAGLYRGGLAVHAGAATALVGAALGPGPVRGLLEDRRLRWLGRVSYGAYLYHWPVFVWISPARLGWDPRLVDLLRIALTLVAAGVSWRWLEAPARRWEVGPSGAALAGIGTAVALVAAAVPAGHTRPGDLIVLDAGPPEPHPARPAGPPSPAPVAVMVVGDSAAASLAVGLQRWGAETGAAVVHNRATEGCGIMRGGEVRYEGEARAVFAVCDDWDGRFRDPVRNLRPAVVVILSGPWDLADRRWGPGEPWRHLGDPVVDARFAADVGDLTRLVVAEGTRVVWLTQPAIRAGLFRGLPPDLPENDPARVDRLNELLVGVVTGLPGATVVDLRAHLRSSPGGELDTAIRPDGVHWSRDGARLTAQWLGPLLVDPGGS